MVEQRSSDISRLIAQASSAHSEPKLDDRKVVRLNAIKKRPLNLTAEGSTAAGSTVVGSTVVGSLGTRRVTVGDNLFSLWLAVLECLVEGFALYGASIHPNAYYLDYLARRHERRATAFGDSPVDDTH